MDFNWNSPIQQYNAVHNALTQTQCGLDLEFEDKFILCIIISIELQWQLVNT